MYTYIYMYRDLFMCQKRPVHMAKETYVYKHTIVCFEGKKRPKKFRRPRPGKPRTPAIYQVQR